MEHQEIIIKLLTDLKEGKQEPKNTDYEISIQEFGDIVEMIQNAELITGASVVRGGSDALIVYLNTAKITLKGLKFIDEQTERNASEEKDYSDEELYNLILDILYLQRGSKRNLTIIRVRKSLPIRLNIHKIEWLLNNLQDFGLVRSHRLASFKDMDGKMRQGEMVYEITPLGVSKRGLERVANEQVASNKGDDEIINESNKVFIIHGHDTEMKNQVQLLISRVGLEDVVLHECPDKGRTIIDKLIEESQDATYVIALMSPDDELSNGAYRARQNVVLEIGYFIGKLGKSRVRILRKGNIEIPSDLQGILYQDYDDQGSWKIKLLKEINAVGIPVDFTKVIAKL